MGTSVINKLRIQGSSASLGDPSLRRASHRNNIDACDTPKHFAFHQATNNIGKVRSYNSPNISHPNSAPSRRQSFLQRVQKANKGLTRHEYPAYSNDYISNKNTIHFLLRGRPVSGDFEMIPPSASPHKRVGHYKTSTTEQYRSRHRFRDMTDFYEDNNNNNQVAINRNDDLFYLGPDATPIANALHPARRSKPVFLPQSAPGAFNGQNSNKATEREFLNKNKTFPGYESRSIVSETTFALSNNDNETKRESTECEYQDDKPVPHPTPLPNKRRHTKSRGSYSEQPSARPPNPDLLNQCLYVQQPSNTIETESAEEIHRYKTGFRGKTTPVRQTKPVNRNSLDPKDSNNKYFFNSVESYVHFNKIYPQVDSNLSSSKATKAISGRALLATHFPRMEGFSPHCTDTLLLKMMFEMNKPARSVKSVSKYSDVAVHKDLDEFMVVSTPTLSRSTSVNSAGLGLPTPSKSNLKSREKASET